MNPAAPILQVRGLTLEAGGRTLVSALDLDVAAGETWAVLGCNGSGKTTLLHALAGVTPGAADIRYGGTRLAEIPARTLGRVRGMLQQQEAEGFWGTLREYVMLGRHPHAQAVMGNDAAGERAVAGALAAFGLETLADRAYDTLSGGERQRARLAQVWAQEPALLLLDEPLQHLDLRHQALLFERLAEDVKNGVKAGEGRAALVVLHDLAWSGHCDRALLLYGDGRWAAGGRELLRPETLSALYGRDIRVCGEGAGRHFLVI